VVAVVSRLPFGHGDHEPAEPQPVDHH